MLVFQIGLILILLLIAFQDFKHLKVSLYLYFGAIALTGVITVVENTFSSTIEWASVNIAILAFQLLLVWLYLFLKYKDIKALFKFIGSGDLVFFVVLALSFSPFNFIVFQILSFILILALHFAIVKNRKKDMLVPLAGYQAILLILILVLAYTNSFNRFSDLFWADLLNNGSY